jgi:hypothetical protein
MSDRDSLEDQIGALLRGPAPAADTAFVARLERRLEAERRLEDARRGAWSRFAREASATAALLTAFILLGRIAPDAATAAAGASAPALAAALLLALWFLVELRPAAAGR